MKNLTKTKHFSFPDHRPPQNSRIYLPQKYSPSNVLVCILPLKNARLIHCAGSVGTGLTHLSKIRGSCISPLLYLHVVDSTFNYKYSVRFSLIRGLSPFSKTIISWLISQWLWVISLCSNGYVNQQSLLFMGF